MPNPFFIDHGGRMTDHRSSCQIMMEMKKNAGLTNSSSIELRQLILNNGKKIAEQNFQKVIDDQKKKLN